MICRISFMTETRSSNILLYCIPMYANMISPFLIWCCVWLQSTFIRLQRLTKSLLPRIAPTTANPPLRIIRSFVNSTEIFFLMLFSAQNKKHYQQNDWKHKTNPHTNTNIISCILCNTTNNTRTNAPA